MEIQQINPKNFNKILLATLAGSFATTFWMLSVAIAIYFGALIFDSRAAIELLAFGSTPAGLLACLQIVLVVFGLIIVAKLAFNYRLEMSEVGRKSLAKVTDAAAIPKTYKTHAANSLKKAVMQSTVRSNLLSKHSF